MSMSVCSCVCMHLLCACGVFMCVYVGVHVCMSVPTCCKFVCMCVCVSE